jgi:hypothetical protein
MCACGFSGALPGQLSKMQLHGENAKFSTQPTELSRLSTSEVLAR